MTQSDAHAAVPAPHDDGDHPDGEWVVAAPQLRVHIAQREFADRYPPGYWLPYVHDAFDTLPARVQGLIAGGYPRSAEYWLLCAERFAGVLDPDAFSAAVDRLGRFAVVHA